MRMAPLANVSSKCPTEAVTSGKSITAARHKATKSLVVSSETRKPSGIALECLFHFDAVLEGISHFFTDAKVAQLLLVINQRL